MPSIATLQIGPEPTPQTVVVSPTYSYVRYVDGPWRALVRTSDGTTFRLAKEDVLALYRQQTGPAAQRKAATRTALLNQITAVLGRSADFDLDFDFDEQTGQLTRLDPNPKPRPAPPAPTRTGAVTDPTPRPTLRPTPLQPSVHPGKGHS